MLREILILACEGATAMVLGSKMLALWIDLVASDDDYRTATSLIFAGMAGKMATGMDVISGIQQQLNTTDDGPDLIVSDLLITTPHVSLSD